MKLRRPLKMIILGIGLSIVFGAFKLGWYQNPSTRDHQLGEAKLGDFIRRVTVAGTIVPFRRAIVSPPYNGYVKSLFVHIGDFVKTGDRIVSVVQSLSGGEIVYPMLAPFSGQVVQVQKTEGEYVEAGKENNAIVRIDDLSKLMVNSEVPENDVARIKRGSNAIIKAPAVPSRTYHGTIREVAIAARESENWRRNGDPVGYHVKIEVTDKDELLRPGMSCLVDIIIDKKDQTLVLAHEFIYKKNDSYYVTLANGDVRAVTIGLKNDEVFEITHGIKPGDQVKIVDFSQLPDKKS